MLNQQKRQYIHIPLIICVLFATGCSSRSPLNQLNPGEVLSVHAVEPKEKLKKVKVSNEEIGESTAEIGGGGAMAGALAGAACGPWFFICMPVGFVAGGIVGTTAGFVVGAAADLDSTTKVTISNKFNKALDTMDVNNNLLKQIQTKSSAIFTVTEVSQTNRLNIYVKDIGLQSYDEGIVLYVSVIAELKYMLPDNKSETVMDEIRYISTPMPVRSWVMADDSFYQQVFSTAYQNLSEQIVFNLFSDDAIAQQAK